MASLGTVAILLHPSGLVSLLTGTAEDQQPAVDAADLPPASVSDPGPNQTQVPLGYRPSCSPGLRTGTESSAALNPGPAPKAPEGRSRRACNTLTRSPAVDPGS